MVLEGQVERGRFGTSVVNLGDIDDDSYEGVCMCIEWHYVYLVQNRCIKCVWVSIGKYG